MRRQKKPVTPVPIIKHAVPSRAQARMLESVLEHGDTHQHIMGMSAHGGAQGTLVVLQRNAWLIYGSKINNKRYKPRWYVTEEGRSALERYSKKHDRYMPALSTKKDGGLK